MAGFRYSKFDPDVQCYFSRTWVGKEIFYKQSVLKQAFIHIKVFDMKSSFRVREKGTFYGYVTGNDCVSQHTTIQLDFNPS